MLPAATESHVNIMNSLSCNIEVLLSTVENGTIGSPHEVGCIRSKTCNIIYVFHLEILFQIEATANKIIMELEPRAYRFEIRVSDDKCAQVSEVVRKVDVPE